MFSFFTTFSLSQLNPPPPPIPQLSTCSDAKKVHKNLFCCDSSVDAPLRGNIKYKQVNSTSELIQCHDFKHVYEDSGCCYSSPDAPLRESYVLHPDDKVKLEDGYVLWSDMWHGMCTTRLLIMRVDGDYISYLNLTQTGCRDFSRMDPPVKSLPSENCTEDTHLGGGYSYKYKWNSTLFQYVDVNSPDYLVFRRGGWGEGMWGYHPGNPFGMDHGDFFHALTWTQNLDPDITTDQYNLLSSTKWEPDKFKLTDFGVTELSGAGLQSPEGRILKAGDVVQYDLMLRIIKSIQNPICTSCSGMKLKNSTGHDLGKTTGTFYAAQNLKEFGYFEYNLLASRSDYQQEECMCDDIFVQCNQEDDNDFAGYCHKIGVVSARHTFTCPKGCTVDNPLAPSLPDCVCLEEWSYDGNEYAGCNGNWCWHTGGTCKQDAAGAGWSQC